MNVATNLSIATSTPMTDLLHQVHIAVMEQPKISALLLTLFDLIRLSILYIIFSDDLVIIAS